MDLETSKASLGPYPREAGGTQLSDPMDTELLRGVPLDVLLSRFGQHFVPPEEGMFNLNSKKYNLSKRVDGLEHFLSHDWKTSRFQKVVALLVSFNTVAASVATIIVSILLGAICAAWGQGIWEESDTAGKPSGWARLGLLSTGLGTWWIVFCFWQRIRRLFRNPKMIFLDILCIAQHDEDKKKKGILGLGTFLDNSKNLTILWSQRYFSRMWCTYEVSTFLRHQYEKPIQVMPVTLAWLFVLMILLSQALAVINVVMDECNCAPLDVVIRAGLAIPGYMFLIYHGIGLIQDLKDLSQQLQFFSVEKADCFCCSCNHVHPQTGKALPCDREMVLQTIRNWFESTDHFDRLVRSRLTKDVYHSIRGLLTAQYPMHVAIASTVPVLILDIPNFFQEEEINVQLGLQHFSAWARLPFASIGNVLILMFACKIGASVVRHRGKMCRIFVSLLLACISPAIVWLMWLPINVLDRYTADKGGLIIVPVMLLLWLHAICSARTSPEVPSDLHGRHSIGKTVTFDEKVPRVDSKDTLSV